MSTLAATLASTLVLTGLVGCPTSSQGPVPPPPTTPLPPALPASVPVAAVTAADVGAAGAVGSHEFLENDLAKAAEVARAGGKLLFVDAWAPWCHTCLSMQREVLSSPTFLARGDRFVFVAIDTDRPENAAFLAAHPVRLWPTFFILDPGAVDGAPLAANPGSMSLAETMAFLDGALFRRTRMVLDPVDGMMARGHAATAAGDIAGAVAAFDEAVKATSRSAAKTVAKTMVAGGQPPGPHARRAEIITTSAWTRTRSGDPEGCVAFITAHQAELTTGSAPGDLQGALLSCAEGLTDPARKKAVQTAAKKRLEAIVKNPPPGAAVDDRADAMATLADLLTDTFKDPAGARALHTARLALLEADANAATSPKAAQVHDYARMNSLFALDRGDEAVTLLQARIQAIPDDYEPRARLASALHRLHREDEADAAVDGAIERSYGPRQLRYLMLKADIAAARGDLPSERRALKRIMVDGGALPASMGAQSLIDQAESRLQGLPRKK